MLAPAIASRTLQQRARLVDAARRVGRDVEEHGHGPRAIERAPAGSSASAMAPSSAKGIGEHERAVAADAPGVAAGAARTSSPIAARPKIRVSTASRSRIAGERDLGAPIEPRLVEQDGRLRQPGEPGARRPASSSTRDLGLAVAGAIDLLGRGRGDGRLGAGAQRHLDVDAVAAGEPAGRVEQHGLGRRRRRPDLGKRTRAAPGLMQDVRARSARPGARSRAGPSLPSAAARSAPAARRSVGRPRPTTPRGHARVRHRKVAPNVAFDHARALRRQAPPRRAP